jgi:hypothetical protein
MPLFLFMSALAFGHTRILLPRLAIGWLHDGGEAVRAWHP